MVKQNIIRVDFSTRIQMTSADCCLQHQWCLAGIFAPKKKSS